MQKTDGEWMNSIRIKITAVTLLTVIVSVLALGFIGVLTMGVESDANSTEKMQLISESAKKSLDAYLNSLKQSVDMADFVAVDSLSEIDLDDYSIPNASSRAVDQTPEQKAQLDAFLTSHCDLVKSAFGSVANGTNGVETYYYCINANLGSSEHGFFYSKVGRPNYEEQEPLNSADLDPHDAEHTVWYYQPIQHGAPVWVGPYRAHYLGEMWAISYVVPTYKDNTLIGVIGMDIVLDTMIAQISALKIYDTGFACLLDQEGHILYHPNLEEGSIPEAISHMIDEGVFQQESSNGELIRYNVYGEDRQLAFSTLSNGFKLVVTAPVSEIAATQRQLTTLIAVVAFAILAAFAIFIMVYMRIMTEPLKKLTAASRRLAAGDYDVELDYNGKDEVGVLTESFRQMRDQLKSHIDDLSDRALTDALTGLKNKSAFDEAVKKLDAAIEASRADDRSDGVSVPEFGLIMFDCNHLKEINDEFGHVHGNDYLMASSKVICQTFAHSPVFRLGGDEFAVLLQGHDYDARFELLENFNQMVIQMNNAAEHPWNRVDLAKGMAVFVPDMDQNVNQVLSRADALMYENKRMMRPPSGHEEGAETEGGSDAS